MVPGSTQKYLDDLNRLQSEMTDFQRQVSSGFRVQRPGDDPFAVSSIAQAQSRISQLQQSQTNLAQLKSELYSGDAALTQASQLVESAISLASQSTNTTGGGTAQNSVLAQQVQGIMETLVKLSATTSGGRFIFSGDLDQQPLYTLDPTQPTGVRQLATATSTRVVTDADGAKVWLSRTASDIFDARNPDGTPATANVFAAVNSLLTALQNNQSTGAQASIDALKAADEHLNEELGYYGAGEARMSDALDASNSALVTETTKLSTLRDADVPSVAVQMAQLSTDQQAALAVRAKYPKMSLFDFLA
jgi:flagellar hook-associated protein 3 FlgL